MLLARPRCAAGATAWETGKNTIDIGSGFWYDDCMQDTSDTTRTRNVLSADHKQQVYLFVKDQTSFIFGSETIGEYVTQKIAKDVLANVGKFSRYSETHSISTVDMIAGFQKRLLRSIGVHVEDEDIVKGANAVYERAIFGNKNKEQDENEGN